jgi:hypothetical protein
MEVDMPNHSEIHEFLLRHLKAIQENDIQTYHATTHQDLSLYEWWITPHRLEGLPFHDFMMAENDRRGTVFGAEAKATSSSEFKQTTRFDLSNLHIQRFGNTAIASYTLLISTGTQAGVQVTAHNESRVIVKMSGQWQVVHVHKSPAWLAPHVQPAIP